MRALIGLVAIALLIYALIDCIRTPEAQSPFMPRIIWFLVMLLVPVIGPIAWLVLTRPGAETAGPQGSAPTSARTPRSPRRPLGPDDDPDFLRKL